MLQETEEYFKIYLLHTLEKKQKLELRQEETAWKPKSQESQTEMFVGERTANLILQTVLLLTWGRHLRSDPRTWREGMKVLTKVLERVTKPNCE